jgi:hypothetical protein
MAINSMGQQPSFCGVTEDAVSGTLTTPSETIPPQLSFLSPAEILPEWSSRKFPISRKYLRPLSSLFKQRQERLQGQRRVRGQGRGHVGPERLGLERLEDVSSEAPVKHRFRRLVLYYERRADVQKAFLTLGCALITWRYLKREF